MTNCKGKFPVLGDFEWTHWNDPSRKANRCSSMVQIMSGISADTITLFSVEI